MTAVIRPMPYMYVTLMDIGNVWEVVLTFVGVGLRRLQRHHKQHGGEQTGRGFFIDEIRCIKL